MKEIKELITFENDNGKKFKIKLVKERNMHKIYLIDEAKAIKNAKIFNSTSLELATNYFHKVIKVYTERLLKS